MADALRMQNIGTSDSKPVLRLPSPGRVLPPPSPGTQQWLVSSVD